MVWTIVIAAIAFLTLLIAIVSPILQLNIVITRLSAIVDNLGKSLETLTNKNSETHTRLWDKIGDQEDKLSDHETRLCVIQKQK